MLLQLEWALENVQPLASNQALTLTECKVNGMNKKETRCLPLKCNKNVSPHSSVQNLEQVMLSSTSDVGNGWWATKALVEMLNNAELQTIGLVKLLWVHQLLKMVNYFH